MKRIKSSKTTTALLSLAVLIAVPSIMAGCASKPKATSSGMDNVSTYSFWPQFPDEPRIQFLTSYRYSTDIEPEKGGLESLVFGEDSNVLAINKPYGLGMWQGKIYVCDIRGDSVIILDLKNRVTKVMRLTGGGGMTQPTDIAITPDGMKYVADRQRSVIYVFDANDRHATTLGHSGMAPVGLAVHEKKLYVCDAATKSVLVLDRFSGDILQTIGSEGGEDGNFIFPLGIAVDDDGYIYVTDAIRCRYQKFTPAGEFMHAVGRIGDVVGSFNRPKHMAVDSDGIIYIVDSNFNNVQMFNERSEILMFFGSSGKHEGALDLPAGLCVNEEDMELFRQYMHPDFEANRLILVTNQFGRNKVSVYAMGQLRDGVTVNDIMPSITPIESGLLTSEQEAALEEEVGSEEEKLGDGGAADTTGDQQPNSDSGDS